MHAHSDIGQAVQLLKQTLPEMQKRSIATTPENYAVWYEYVSGNNVALINEINLLDLNRTPFTSSLHRELYQRHVATKHEATVNQLSDSVKGIVNAFLLQSRQEGEGLGHYTRILQDLSVEAESTQDMTSLRLMVAQLIEHTKQREVASGAMQASLTNMTKDMQQLKEEVARLSGESSVDPITRVATRPALNEDLETHLMMAQSGNEPLSFILLQVDKLSEFREKFGDTISDKVLKFIATLFKKNLKGGDQIARYDQDSFAVILPDTPLKGAHHVAENLRHRLAKQTLSDSAEKVQLGTVTVSASVVGATDKDDVRSLTKKAELMLNNVRSQGGNNVQSS